MATQLVEPLSSTREARQDALFNDAMLFCTAFTAGAVVFLVGHVLLASSNDYWSAGGSDHLLLSGLVAGELFLLWNNGYRQGVRGHSIGKHRMGLRVVDVDTGRPTGAARGLARGLVMVVVLDLAAAAVPIGMPTVARSATPDSWHFGVFAYVALVLLLVPLLLPSHRGFADVVVRTEVVEATGEDAVTTSRHRSLLVVLDVIGLVGVVVVVANYAVYVWPFLRFPTLF